jgi:DNA-binding transcriptional MerR regulator
MEANLTIGRLAESARVNVETVRFYRDVTRIRFIQRAR